MKMSVALTGPASSLRILVSPEYRHPQYSAQLALDSAARRKVFQLRYRGYLSAGLIDSNPSGVFEDDSDSLPNSVSILIYQSGSPIASMRTCFLAENGTLTASSRKTFASEIDHYLDTIPARSAPSSTPGAAAGYTGIEWSWLVRSPEAANNQGAVFLLYRLADYLATQNSSQVAFACVRENAAGFHSRLGFTPASTPRAYPGVKCRMQLLVRPGPAANTAVRQFPLTSAAAAPPHSYDGFLAGELIPVSLLQTP